MKKKCKPFLYISQRSNLFICLNNWERGQGFFKRQGLVIHSLGIRNIIINHLVYLINDHIITAFYVDNIYKLYI